MEDGFRPACNILRTCDSLPFSILPRSTEKINKSGGVLDSLPFNMYNAGTFRKLRLRRPIFTRLLSFTRERVRLDELLRAGKSWGACRLGCAAVARDREDCAQETAALPETSFNLPCCVLDRPFLALLKFSEMMSTIHLLPQ